MDTTIRIKRYPNRRLYDRSAGRYVTLTDIEQIVRDGGTVEVRDSKTDEDITRAILTQIILERQPEKMELFPIPMLHTILRANDMVRGFLGDYLRQSLTHLERMQAPPTGLPFVPPAEWFRNFFPGFPLPTGGSAATPPPTRESNEETLKRKVAELERRVESLELPPEDEPIESDEPPPDAENSDDANAGPRRQPRKPR